MLTAQDEMTIRYATRNIHSLNFADGDISYDQIGVILGKLEDYFIYTYSSIAAKFIQQFLPTSVVTNTKDLGHILAESQPDPNCFRIHRDYRYCAKAKAIEVKDFIENELYTQYSGQ